jgi:hypothetical protein
MKSLYTQLMSQRLRPLILSLLFLLVSVGTYHLGASYLSPNGPAVETPAGVWQQYVIADGQPVYLATFAFQKSGSDYEVSAVDVAPCTFPQSGFRTFGHQYDGVRWTFNSDWHEYGVAQFELEKVDTNRFEGYAYLDGEQRPYRHILLRVGD